MKTRAVVEIPKGSFYKYEAQKEGGLLRLDRPLNRSIPHNYGYIPGTMCEDGDPLDVFIISCHAISALTEVDVEIVGVFKATDNGVEDDKLLAVIPGEHVPADFIDDGIRSIADYLHTYKEGFVVDLFEKKGQAIQTYQLSRVWENPAD